MSDKLFAYMQQVLIRDTKALTRIQCINQQLSDGKLEPKDACADIAACVCGAFNAQLLLLREYFGGSTREIGNE